MNMISSWVNRWIIDLFYRELNQELLPLSQFFTLNDGESSFLKNDVTAERDQKVRDVLNGALQSPKVSSILAIVDEWDGDGEHRFPISNSLLLESRLSNAELKDLTSKLECLHFRIPPLLSRFARAAKSLKGDGRLHFLTWD